MFGRRFFGARYFPPRYFGGGGSSGSASDYFGNRYFAARYFGHYYWGNPGAAAATTATNSGVQRLRAFHDREGQDAYYREVQRREALQVQQIRLSELLGRQQEVEAKRIADEALRKAGGTQRGKAKAGTLLPNPALDDRIAALEFDLAEVSRELVLTRAEIARLDHIEMQEALAASMREDDEIILILAASI